MKERFLDAGSTAPTLDGYSLVARHNRGSTAAGIAVPAACHVAPTVALLMKSETAERVWILIHWNCGALLVGCWHRPPAYGEVASIQSFAVEWERLSNAAIATLIIGDVDVHPVRWLHYSATIHPEGKELQSCCSFLFAVSLANINSITNRSDNNFVQLQRRCRQAGRRRSSPIQSRHARRECDQMGTRHESAQRQPGHEAQRVRAIRCKRL